MRLLLTTPAYFIGSFFDLLAADAVDAADVFVRVLKTVDEEIACREAQTELQQRARNTQIKDRMREQCMPQLVDTCLNIVESASADTAHVPLARSCLDVLSTFTWWVDLSLIACDRFLALLAKFLSNEDLRISAANNLHAIVCKQMQPEEKMPLLQRLELLPLLQTGAALVDEACVSEHENFIGRLAALTTAFATECMNCSDLMHGRGGGVPDDADRFLLGCVPLVGMYMNALGHGDSSSCCVKFLQNYFNRLRRVAGRDPSAAQPHIGHVRPLVPVLVNKMMFPLDFSFDKGGEDEVEFVGRRKELCVLFRTAAAIDETAALQVMRASKV